MRTIIFSVFVSLVFGFNNLRKISQTSSNEKCQNPCLDIVEKIMPSATLGFSSNQNGYSFQSYQNKQILYLCCDQQKTYDFLNGLIVPDFTDVKQLEVKDQANLSVTISPSDIVAKYFIKVHHQFQRVALELSANDQLQANVTQIISQLADKNKCNYEIDLFEYNWFSVFAELGKQVSTQISVGAEFDIYFMFYTNTNYTEQQVTDKYLNHINTQNLMTLPMDFDTEQYAVMDATSAGIHLGDCQNFQDYLNKLGPQNYIKVNSNNFNNTQVIDSLQLFDQSSSEIKQCSQEAWNYIFSSKQIF